MPTPSQREMDKAAWEYFMRHGLGVYVTYLFCTLLALVWADGLCRLLGVYDE